MPVHPELEASLTAFLERFTPPRHIAGNTDAVRQEVAQLTDAFARFAPRDGFQTWWLSVTNELVRRMKTRAWPMVAEVEIACQAARQLKHGSMGEDAIEAMILDRMEDWYRRFKSQMPGYGKASRTMALIRRGVFANEREARFRGFDLSHDMKERAFNQRIGQDELTHHRRVMGDLRALSERVAANGSDAKAKHSTVIPDDDPGEVAYG